MNCVALPDPHGETQDAREGGPIVQIGSKVKQSAGLQRGKMIP
jgi:hypothetical protein